ncbi:unnamed protein product, partial [Acanthocheilonema viteae]
VSGAVTRADCFGGVVVVVVVVVFLVVVVVDGCNFGIHNCFTAFNVRIQCGFLRRMKLG